MLPGADWRDTVKKSEWGPPVSVTASAVSSTGTMPSSHGEDATAIPPPAGLIDEPRRDSYGYRCYGSTDLLWLLQARTLSSVTHAAADT